MALILVEALNAAAWHLNAHRCVLHNAHMRSNHARRVYDLSATKRAVNLTLNSDLVHRARAEGLNLSAIAEEAVAAALARRAREKFDAEIAQACRAHDAYLAEYGSLGEALRNQADGAG